MASEATVAKCLKVIFSGFPAMGNRDGLPEFSRLAMSALMKFPDRVIVDLANPHIGILQTARFLPSVAELVDWCHRRDAEVCRPEDEAKRAALRILPPPAPDQTTAAERKAIADRIRDGLQSLRDQLADKPEQYGSENERREKASARLIELRSHYAISPVMLSERAREIFARTPAGDANSPELRAAPKTEAA